MDALLTALARLVGGQFHVFQPMARRYHFKKIVKCPETDEAAEILLKAYPSTTAKVGKKPSIRNCSLWPSRRGCMQSCVDRLTAPPGR